MRTSSGPSTSAILFPDTTWAMGRHAVGVAHFEESLAFCRKARARPELAWTCHSYAAALLERRSSDTCRATSLLEEALSISTELGMHPLIQRVTALKEQVESQPALPAEYPAGLTQREVEVMRLLALGKLTARSAMSWCSAIARPNRWGPPNAIKRPSGCFLELYGELWASQNSASSSGFGHQTSPLPRIFWISRSSILIRPGRPII